MVLRKTERKICRSTSAFFSPDRGEIWRLREELNSVKRRRCCTRDLTLSYKRGFIFRISQTQITWLHYGAAQAGVWLFLAASDSTGHIGNTSYQRQTMCRDSKWSLARYAEMWVAVLDRDRGVKTLFKSLIYINNHQPSSTNIFFY